MQSRKRIGFRNIVSGKSICRRYAKDLSQFLILVKLKWRYIGICCANLIPKLFTAKVQIVQYPEVVREAPGTPKDMQCTATGDPPPLISWLKDGTPVNDSTCNIPHYHVILIMSIIVIQVY